MYQLLLGQTPASIHTVAILLLVLLARKPDLSLLLVLLLLFRPFSHPRASCV